MGEYEVLISVDDFIYGIDNIKEYFEQNDIVCNFESVSKEMIQDEIGNVRAKHTYNLKFKLNKKGYFKHFKDFINDALEVIDYKIIKKKKGSNENE